MRSELTVALALLQPAVFAAHQSGPPTVYYAASGVTAPELLPANLINAATGHCDKFDRTELVSAVVDATGVPRDISLLQPAGTDLDKTAINIATADRFKPGTFNGAAASVAISIELKIYSCIELKKNERGQSVYSLQLRTLPDQKVDLQLPPSMDGNRAFTGAPPPTTGYAAAAPNKIGGHISAPVLLRSVPPEFSENAREDVFGGVCMISLIVDEHGMPRDVHVVRSLEPTLDESAVNAVRQYRFQPAVKDGKVAVPVMITIEVDFRPHLTTP